MTVIQLKFSESTSTPVSLNVAEPAYSNTSNKFFIGGTNGAPIAIGGKYYTDIIDAATNANTASTLVKRDASGMFSATAVRASLFGNANTAATWQTARLIGVEGDATGQISVDGSANANVPLTLAASGVTSGIYGGGGQSVAITIDSKGRITSASNVALGSSTINAAANSGTGSFSTGGTLTLAGSTGGGITTTYADATDTFAFAVDSTVVRTSGAQAITGDLSVTGDFTVTGTTTTVNTSTVTTTDSLIKLATNNTVGDIVDIGFYGSSNPTGSSVKYHGLIREGSGGTNASAFYLFKDLATDPTGNVVSYGGLTKADLYANIKGGQISGLTSAIAVADGGTGAGTFTGGGIIIGNGTGALQTLANSTYTLTGSLSTAKTISSLTVDAYGRVTAATGSDIAIDTAAITSGTLAYARGGTGSTSYTTGTLLVAGATGLLSLANSSYTLTGALSAAKTITSLTVDAYGRVTAATGADISIDTSQLGSGTIAYARMPTKGTAGSYGSSSYVPVITTDAYGRVTGVSNTQISIDTSQITSGTLGIVRGGTGVSSFTANSVVLSGITAGSALVSLNSSTEGHFLQINSAGVPVFAFLNGGSF